MCEVFAYIVSIMMLMSCDMCSVAHIHKCEVMSLPSYRNMSRGHSQGISGSCRARAASSHGYELHHRGPSAGL